MVCGWTGHSAAWRGTDFTGLTHGRSRRPVTRSGDPQIATATEDAPLPVFVEALPDLEDSTRNAPMEPVDGRAAVRQAGSHGRPRRYHGEAVSQATSSTSATSWTIAQLEEAKRRFQQDQARAMYSRLRMTTAQVISLYSKLEPDQRSARSKNVTKAGFSANASSSTRSRCASDMLTA